MKKKILIALFSLLLIGSLCLIVKDIKEQQYYNQFKTNEEIVTQMEKELNHWGKLSNVHVAILESSIFDYPASKDKYQLIRYKLSADEFSDCIYQGTVTTNSTIIDEDEKNLILQFIDDCNITAIWKKQLQLIDASINIFVEQRYYDSASQMYIYHITVNENFTEYQEIYNTIEELIGNKNKAKGWIANIDERLVNSNIDVVDCANDSSTIYRSRRINHNIWFNSYLEKTLYKEFNIN